MQVSNDRFPVAVERIDVFLSRLPGFFDQRIVFHDSSSSSNASGEQITGAAYPRDMQTSRILSCIFALARCLKFHVSRNETPCTAQIPTWAASRDARRGIAAAAIDASANCVAGSVSGS